MFITGCTVSKVLIFDGVKILQKESALFQIVSSQICRNIARHYYSEAFKIKVVLITDGWKAYDKINQMGMWHKNLTFNYSMGFADEDAGAHTNNNTEIKMNISSNRRTRLVPRKALEFIRRRKNTVTLWSSFIKSIQIVYLKEDIDCLVKYLRNFSINAKKSIAHVPILMSYSDIMILLRKWIS